MRKAKCFIKQGLAMACAFALVTVTSGSATGVVQTAKAAETKVQEETKTVEAVTFSKTSGTYDSEFLLELNAKGNQVYYTTDGSNPITSTTRVEYNAPISVKDRSGEGNVLAAIDPALFDSANVKWDSKNKKFTSKLKTPSNEDVDKATVIRAVSVDAEGNYSKVGTNTYFIGSMDKHISGIKESCEAAGIDMAVMSLVAEKDDFFDSKKGIYVHGDIFDKALEEYLNNGGSISGGNAVDVARSLDANYKQKGREWEREVHMDYFESNGAETVLKLQQDCGVRIQGNYSRSDLQKGLRLYARADYGEKNFKYPFFENAKNDEGKTIDKFKKLTLRNGGNCAFTTKFSDTYWQSLIDGLKCETQASRVCVLYLNGEYWGVYILQEDYDDSYFEETHGVNKDDVIVYKGDAEALEIGYKLDEGSLPEGETDESYYFRELIDFCKKHDDLSDTADYEEFAKIVDVESVRDYFAVNVWVNNKWDWPGKNWSMWKTINVDENNPYADGRYRLCYYDLDFGGVSGVSDAYTNTLQEDKLLDIDRWLYEKDQINPPTLSFAMLMTNDAFRADFVKSLRSLTQKQFEKKLAVEACTKYLNIYKPLYSQFFTRYGFNADRYSNDAENGGYASYRCMVDFISNRAPVVEEMVEYVDFYYAPFVEPEEEEVIVKQGGSTKVGLELDNCQIEDIKVTSTNKKVAKVSLDAKTGKVKINVPKTATKGAVSTIKVSCGGEVCAKITVMVKNPAKKLVPLKKKITIKKGKSAKITCKIIAQNPKKPSNDEEDAVISNENIAFVSYADSNGKKVVITVDAVKKGTTTLKIKVGSKSVKVKVTVK